MRHQTEIDLAVIVVEACTFTQDARLHIALALSCSKENVSAPAAFEHAFCYIMVFIFITIIGKLGSVPVPIEVCANLITNIL